MSKSLSAKKVGGLVVLVEREWCGVGRPDYNHLDRMTPDNARHLADQLYQAAEACDGKKKRQSEKRKVDRVVAKIVAEAKREADL
ncbi:MAG TPA: hypothetical protein PL193_07715 [Xanthobacteraceae bacterium]|nr:hypothetical protein [Xanthobacteraceae bacterium]